jgi:hypothetical protein
MPWGLLLKAGPYALIGLALLWGGFEHSWRVTLQRNAATEVAKAQAEVAAYREADAANTRRIEDAHAAEVNRLRGEASARENAIRRSVASMSCIDTPAYRAFVGSLPGTPGKAGAGPSDGPRRTGPSVPR